MIGNGTLGSHVERIVYDRSDKMLIENRDFPKTNTFDCVQRVSFIEKDVTRTSKRSTKMNKNEQRDSQLSLSFARYSSISHIKSCHGGCVGVGISDRGTPSNPSGHKFYKYVPITYTQRNYEGTSISIK